jgi:tetratricopeptide (TPR) repeat protein
MQGQEIPRTLESAFGADLKCSRAFSVSQLLEPANGETHYQLGLALARAGRKDEAAAELQQGRDLSAADDRTRNASLDITEGRAALDRGELDAATTKFRHAAQLEPDSPDAQQYLGSALEKQGNTDGAIAAYRKALALTSIAGIGRLPQVSMPISSVAVEEGQAPVGLSLVASFGEDEFLLRIVQEIDRKTEDSAL